MFHWSDRSPGNVFDSSKSVSRAWAYSWSRELARTRARSRSGSFHSALFLFDLSWNSERAVTRPSGSLSRRRRARPHLPTRAALGRSDADCGRSRSRASSFVAKGSALARSWRFSSSHTRTVAAWAWVLSQSDECSVAAGGFNFHVDDARRRRAVGCSSGPRVEAVASFKYLADSSDAPR